MCQVLPGVHFQWLQVEEIRLTGVGQVAHLSGLQNEKQWKSVLIGRKLGLREEINQIFIPLSQVNLYTVWFDLGHQKIPKHRFQDCSYKLPCRLYVLGDASNDESGLLTTH